MRFVFALLPDDDVHNYFRHKAYEIDKLIDNGFIGAFLPPHISLKQSVVIDDLKPIENLFDTLSSQMNPILLTFDKYVRWDNVIMANIVEQDVLRKLHYRINDGLLGLCKNPQADHDGEDYHFHLTIAYGGQSPDMYQKAYEKLCHNHIDMKVKVNRLGLLYYENDDNGVGKFITYKISRLER